jgi:hypothetical protein
VSIDVSTPGFGIDVTSAEFLFDGESLSAAIESMEFSTKTDEEIVHFQGLQDPQERTAGQRSHEATLTWGTRQYLLFCDRFGGWDEVKNKEFTLVVNAEPRNDDKVYSLTFYAFRLHSDSINLDKSASKNKISASFLSFESEVVQS